jgi:hypothetical protein
MSIRAVAIAAIATIAAQFSVDAEDGKKTEVTAPSPDGKLALLDTWTPSTRSLDIIEKDTGKVLARAAERDDGNRLDTTPAWAPDSRKVALGVSFARAVSELVVFARDKSGTWREISIPPLPAATIPKKYNGDPRIHHVGASDFTTPVRWQKDGTLVVETRTTVDGNANFITATRTTVLAFGRDGKARVTATSQKVKAHFEDPIEPGTHQK